MKKLLTSRLPFSTLILLTTILKADVHSPVLNSFNSTLKPIPLDIQNQVKFSDIREGTLVRRIEDGDKFEVLPNLKTRVNIQVDGLISTTTVDQMFSNPSTEAIEAIYVFPLPVNAAVNEMKMIINDRFIQGEIKEKQEARKTYEKARKAGKRASLTEQNRPNIFTNTVANIMPDDTLIVRLKFVDKLYYENGKFQLRFPLVVAPRYIPGDKITGYSGSGWAFDTNQVPDASQITPPVVEPGMRSGNMVSISIDLRPGLDIRHIHSVSHEITTTKPDDGNYHIKLLNKDEIPNKDFILEYTAARENEPSAALFTSELSGEHYFMLMALPPMKNDEQDVIPRNITFVIDVSGSMSGTSIVQAKSGFEFALDRLYFEDTFNIISFNNSYHQLSHVPLSGTRENIELGKQYVRNLTANGGTQALPALLAAMNMTQAENKLNLVIFLTDGSVGNENEIIAAIHQHLGKARLFSVGIGSAPNSHLLEQVSRQGKGSFTFISSTHEVSSRMSELIAKIENPVITDLTLNIAGIAELYPDPLPDLFINEPVVVFGKLNESSSQDAILTGRINNEMVSLSIPLFITDSKENPGIPSLWARANIADLTNQYHLGNREIKQDIIDLAIQYHLMSKFTSFVAVEHKIVNPSGRFLTSAFPTDLPEGWEFEKVFGKHSAIQLAELPKTATRNPLYLMMGFLMISMSLFIRLRFVPQKI